MSPEPVVARAPSGSVAREEAAGTRREGAFAAVVVPFLVQRGVLMIVALVASRSIPMRTEGWRPVPSTALIEPWFRYDSTYYLEIAHRGYALPDVARFFPGYPWLVRVGALGMPVTYAAFFVANAAALAALVLFHAFLLRMVDGRTARRAVHLLLLFPSSFFLSAAYSESTYALAVALALLGWKKEDGALAAAGVFLGSITRPVGAVCLTLPFVVEWLVKDRRLPRAPWFTLAAIPAAALVLASHYLAGGDAFAFVKAGVQSAYGAFQTLPRKSAFATLTSEGLGLELLRRIQNWGVLVFALVASGWLARRGHVALAVMTAASVAVPLAVQRTLFDATSMGRYVLGGLPFALALAAWSPEDDRPRRLDFLFASLQTALLVAFTTWTWIE